MQHDLVLNLHSLFPLTSLHGPAGTCISVASVSPTHVPPIQHVLISIVVCTHTHTPHTHTHKQTHDPKQSLDAPAGKLHPPDRDV